LLTSLRDIASTLASRLAAGFSTLYNLLSEKKDDLVDFSKERASKGYK
jgi:hypothetical protein